MIFKKLIEKRDNYERKVSAFDAAETEIRRLISAAESAIHVEKSKDEKRLAKLQKDVENSPRAELARINARLSETPKNAAEFWTAYYSGRTTAIPEQERQQLEKRRQKLEAALALAPVTPQDQALAALMVKSYPVNDETAQRLKTAFTALEKANQNAQAANAEFREALTLAQKEMQVIQSSDDLHRKTAHSRALVEIHGKLNALLNV